MKITLEYDELPTLRNGDSFSCKVLTNGSEPAVQISSWHVRKGIMDHYHELGFARLVHKLMARLHWHGIGQRL